MVYYNLTIISSFDVYVILHVFYSLLVKIKKLIITYFSLSLLQQLVPLHQQEVEQPNTTTPIKMLIFTDTGGEFPTSESMKDHYHKLLIWISTIINMGRPAYEASIIIAQTR